MEELRTCSYVHVSGHGSALAVRIMDEFPLSVERNSFQCIIMGVKILRWMRCRAESLCICNIFWRAYKLVHARLLFSLAFRRGLLV